MTSKTFIEGVLTKFNDNPLFRSGGFYPFRYDVESFLTSSLEEAFRVMHESTKVDMKGGNNQQNSSPSCRTWNAALTAKHEKEREFLSN